MFVAPSLKKGSDSSRTSIFCVYLSTYVCRYVAVHVCVIHVHVNLLVIKHNIIKQAYKIISRKKYYTVLEVNSELPYSSNSDFAFVFYSFVYADINRSYKGGFILTLSYFCVIITLLESTSTRQ